MSSARLLVLVHPAAQDLNRFFLALMDEQANFFQLAYDERTTGWKVTRVWVE